MPRYLTALSAFAFVVLCRLPSSDAAWGAVPVSDSLRPNQAFISNFPSTNTVVVNAGDDIEAKIAQCNSLVGGTSGYCRVYINGKPSGSSGFTVTRSRTMIVGRAGVVLTGSGNMAFVRIASGMNRIVIQELEIMGHSANYHTGVEIDGANIEFVAVMSCKFHDFNAGGGDAHAIVVRGSGATSVSAVQHLIIDGNEIFDMKLGSSEAIAINGNVERWIISNNDVYDINNIAIDAIGGEGTSPTTTVNGRVVPGNYDAARIGWIEDNFVENMSTVGNLAYGNVASWAAAIYVDGGRQITVKNNVVVNVPWGYEAGGENCVTTQDITFIGNSATGSFYGDFLAGGYETQGYLANTNLNCDPLSTTDNANEGHGYVKRVTAVENQFSSTGVTEQVINPQYRLTETVIVDPNAQAVNTGNNGFASGDNNAIRTTL